MKLEDLRAIAKTSIDPKKENFRNKDLPSFTLTIDETESNKEITKKIKCASIIMSDYLEWKAGTHFILKEGLDVNKFSSAILLMKKSRVGKVWICKIQYKGNACVIEIPHYQSVKDKLGIRISIDPKFFGTERMVGFLEIVRKKVLIETCEWPSTTLIAMDKDIFRRVTIFSVQDGKGNSIVVPASEKAIGTKDTFDFDFPHYHSFT